jgi:Pectate lyase superfamily protein
MGSKIDATRPADGVPASKADLRTNLQIARDELNHGGFFSPQGVGAVERTVQSKLQGFVDVQDFGAIGDGVADDTAAVQAALDAHLSVFLPEGDYKITDTLRFRTDQAIQGVGMRSRILARQPSAWAALGPVIPAADKWTEQTSFSNFKILGNGTAGVIGLHLLRCFRAYVANIHVEGIGGWAFVSDGTADTVNTEITRSQSHHHCFINCQVYGTNERGFVFVGPATGEGTNRGTLVNCRVAGSSEWGFWLDQQVSDWQFVGCQCESLIGRAGGIFCDGSDNVWVGLSLESTPGDGIQMGINARTNSLLFVRIANTVATEPDTHRINNGSRAAPRDPDLIVWINNTPMDSANNMSGFKHWRVYDDTGTKALVLARMTPMLGEIAAQRYMGVTIDGRLDIRNAADTGNAVELDINKARFLQDVELSSGFSLQLRDSGWNAGRLKLGNYNLWVDASGKLRIKNAAPASDTDGSVVGTQTT